MERIARVIRDLNGVPQGRNMENQGYQLVNVEFPTEHFDDALGRIKKGLDELGASGHVRVEAIKPEKPREATRFLMIKAATEAGKDKIKEMMDAWRRLPKD